MAWPISCKKNDRKAVELYKKGADLGHAACQHSYGCCLMTGQGAKKDVKQAFKVKGCIYLYVHTARAFLIPDGQASASPDELWRFLQKCLGPEKCISRR